MYLDKKPMRFMHKMLVGVNGGRDIAKVQKGDNIKTAFVYFCIDEPRVIGSDGWKAFEIKTSSTVGKERIGLAYDKIKHLKCIKTIEKIGEFYYVSSDTTYTIVDDYEDYDFPTLDSLLSKPHKQENLFGNTEEIALGVNEVSKQFEEAITVFGSYTKTVDKKVLRCEGSFMQYQFKAICTNM